MHAWNLRVLIQVSLWDQIKNKKYYIQKKFKLSNGENGFI